MRIFIVILNIFVFALVATGQPSWIEEGLILHYSFDGSLENGVERELKGELLGGSYGPDYTGGEGNSLLLSGGSKAVLPSAKLPIGNSSRTVAFWVRPLKIEFLNDIVRYGEGDCVANYFAIGTEAPCCSSDNNDNVSFSSGCNDKSSGLKLVSNQWNFVAAAYEAGKLLFCVNGQTAKIDIEELDTTKDTNLVLGGGGPYTFNGAIDELKIFNRSLSIDELHQVYESEQDNREFVELLKDSVKAYFPLGADGDSFVSGDGLTEDYNINSFIEGFDGKSEEAAYFNRVDSSNKDGLRVNSSLIESEFSLFFWTKKTDSLGLLFTNDRIPNRSITLTTDERGKIGLSFVTPEWLSTTSYPLESAGYRKNVEFALVDEVWTHVGIVHSNGIVRAFKNGQLFGQQIIEGFTGVAPPVENTSIIAFNEYSPFKGALDELIILDEAVSEIQARKLFERKLDVNKLGGVTAKSTSRIFCIKRWQWQYE